MFENVIPMLIMVQRVDEMSDVMQQGCDLQEQPVLFVQAMQRKSLIEDPHRKFCDMLTMLLVELIFLAQAQRRGPSLFTAGRTPARAAPCQVPPPPRRPAATG